MAGNSDSGNEAPAYARLIDGDLNEALSILDSSYLPAFLAVMSAALDAVADGSVPIPPGYQLRLVPGIFLGGASPPFVGEDGKDRFRNSYSLNFAGLVGLGDVVMLGLRPDGGEAATAPLRVVGIDRVARIKLKRNFVSCRALEFSYRDIDPVDPDEDLSMPRALVLMPNQVPSGVDAAWQERLFEMLTFDTHGRQEQVGAMPNAGSSLPDPPPASSATPAPRIFCTTCGSKLPDHRRYCPGCGSIFSWDDE